MVKRAETAAAQATAAVPVGGKWDVKFGADKTGHRGHSKPSHGPGRWFGSFGRAGGTSNLLRCNLIAASIAACVAQTEDTVAALLAAFIAAQRGLAKPAVEAGQAAVGCVQLPNWKLEAGDCRQLEQQAKPSLASGAHSPPDARRQAKCGAGLGNFSGDSNQQAEIFFIIKVSSAARREWR